MSDIDKDLNAPHTEETQETSVVNTKKDPKAREVKVKDFAKTELETLSSEKDFGQMLMDGEATEEGMANMFGNDLKLKSKKEYWDNPENQKNFKDFYGDDDDAEKKFDLFYQGLEGRYSKYKQDSFDIERANRSLATTSLNGGPVNENKVGKKYGFQVVDKTITGAIEYDGEFYGPEKSVREAMTEKVSLTVGEDENGKPITREFDLTPKLRDELLSLEGFDGFAYDQEALGYGNGYRGKASMTGIINGEVWNKRTNKFEAVRNDQIVSNWDIAPDTLLANMLQGNGLEMNGIDYAKLLIRSPLNTAIEFLDIIPQIGRGILGATYGEDVHNMELYKKLTSFGINLKGAKTSMTDEARRDGFFGSAEVFLSTIADVASQLVLAGGVGGGIKTIGGGMKAQGFSTRMSLTMMAAKDMYQETLEHGFTEREAGVAMGAAVFAMWQANSFSKHITEGVEPSAMKHFAKKIATRDSKTLMDVFRKTAIKEGKSAASKGLMNGMTKSMKGMNSLMEKGKDFMYSHDVWFSMIEEATEEVLEELSTEGVRQLMNGWQAFRGHDLSTTSIGKGRFKSYWDHGYWDELKQSLLVSGIAGGIGGPMGKVMMGGAAESKFNVNSTMLDFALAGGSDTMNSAIIAAAKDNAYGPAGMTTEINSNTNAFITNGNGKTMNELARDVLLQDMLVISTVVNDMGLNAKQMIDMDPELKANMSKTSLAEDIKKHSEKLITLISETGIGTNVLKALEDGDIETALLEAGDSQTVHKKNLEQDAYTLQADIDKLKEAKAALNGEVKKGEEDKDTEKKGEFTPEMEEKLKELQASLKEKESLISSMGDTVEKSKLVEIQKTVSAIRGINNGSAGEKYYTQYTLHDNPVFGSMQNRAPQYVRHGKNFFANALDNSRQSMSQATRKQANIYEKSLENDKRIQGMTMDNIDDYQDIFNETPFMSMESVNKIKDIRKELEDNTESLDAVKLYMKSDAYTDGVIAAATKRYDNSVWAAAMVDNGNGWEDGPEVNAEGISKDFVEYMKGPEFRDMFKYYNDRTVDSIKSFENFKMLYLNSQDVMKYSDEFLQKTASPNWANAVHVMGEIDAINNTKQEFFIKNILGLETMFDGSEQQMYNNFFKRGTMQNAESGMNADPNITAITKAVTDLQAADSRLSLIRKFDVQLTGNVSGGDGGTTSEAIRGQFFIDPTAPELLSPFSTEWLGYEVTGNVGEKMNSIDGDIFEKVVSLADSMDTKREADGEPATGFSLSPAAKAQVESALNSVEIRKAQRDVLRQFLSGKNPHSGHRMLHDIAGFRKNTLRIIGDKPFPYSPKFSQLENHNYKNNTALSDFINDFAFDAIHLSDTLKKAEMGAPLNQQEKENIANAERYIQVLQPRESVHTPAGEELKMIRDIQSEEDLINAQSFMLASDSLDQAEEILLGINYLVNEMPFNPEEIDSVDHFKERRKGVIDKIKEYTTASLSPLPHLINFLTLNSHDIPAGLQELYDVTLSIDPAKDLVTEEQVQKMEKAIFNFMRAVPEIKKNITDTQFKALMDSTSSKMTLELMLFEKLGDNSFDVDSFFERYLEKVNEMKDTTGHVPMYPQEQNALFINAFLHHSGAILTADEGKLTDETIVMFINGVAGAGKTHMVASLGLGIAQETAAKRHGEDKTKVIYASNHKTQIENLKGGLGEIVTTDQGKTNSGLISMLEQYIANPGDNDSEAVKELDSSFVIVYDEATQLNTKVPEDSTPNEETLTRLISLIEQVNAMKRQKNKGLPELKLILLGDSEQSGYKDPDSRILSSITTLGSRYNFIRPPKMDYNFRVTNRYLKKALSDIRDFGNVDKSKTFTFGTQRDDRGRYAGAQVVSYPDNAFNKALDDIDLAADIERQIAEDKYFRVGIIPDDTFKIDESTAIGKLIRLHSDNVFVYSTSKVQGLEFDYVITEFTNEYVGDFSSAEAKTSMSKDMYTLMSRARGFVKVVNSNNTRIQSKREDNRLVKEPESRFKASKNKAIKYINDLYSGLVPIKQTTEENNDENNDDEGDCGIPIGADGGIVRARKRRACIIDIKKKGGIAVSQDMAATVASIEKRVGEKFGKKLIPAFKVFVKLGRQGAMDAIADPDSMKFNTRKKLLSKGGANGELMGMLEQVWEAKEQSLRNIKSQVEDKTLEIAMNHTGSIVNTEGRVQFANEVIEALRQDPNTGIVLNAAEVVDILQSTIHASIDRVINAGAGGSVQLDMFGDSAVYTPFVSPNENKGKVPVFVEDKYKEELTKHKGVQGIFDYMKTLEDKLSVSPNNKEANIEYADLRALIEQAKDIEGLMPGVIIPNFSDTSAGVQGRIGSEEVLEGYGDRKVGALIYNARSNQLKYRGGRGELNMLTPSSANVKYLKDQKIIPENTLSSSEDVYDAVYSGDLVSVRLVGKRKDVTDKRTGVVRSDLNTAFIGTMQNGDTVLLGKPFLGELSAGMASTLKSKKNLLNKDLNLTGDRAVVDSDFDNPIALSAKMFPTSHALAANIYNNNVINHPIKLKDFLNGATVNAGKPKDLSNKGKQTLSEFKKNRKNNRIQTLTKVSKVILINKSGLLKNIKKGQPFTVYTTNPHIANFDDPDVVLGFLNTLTATGGEFSRGLNAVNNTGQAIKADIGILPLDTVNVSFTTLLNENFEVIENGGMPVDNLNNKILSKRHETTKVAKILSKLALKILKEKGDIVKPFGKGDVSVDVAAVISQLEDIDLFKKETSFGSPKKQFTHGEIDDDMLNDFLDKLIPPADQTNITKEDLLASLLVPFIRNFSVEMYSKAGGESYAAKYYSMYKKFPNKIRNAEGELEETGTFTEDFNLLNFLGAATTELSHRLGNRANDKRIAKRYMEAIMLPVLTELIARTDIYSPHARTFEQGTFKQETLKNGKKIDASVEFTTSVLGDSKFSDNTNPHFFVAADTELNNRLLATTAEGFEFPYVRFDMDNILKDLTGVTRDEEVVDGFTPSVISAQMQMEERLQLLTDTIDQGLDSMTEDEFKAAQATAAALKVWDKATYMKNNGFSVEESSNYSTIIDDYISDIETESNNRTLDTKGDVDTVDAFNTTYNTKVENAIVEGSLTDIDNLIQEILMESISIAGAMNNAQFKTQITQDGIALIKKLTTAKTEQEKEIKEIDANIEGIIEMININSIDIDLLNEIKSKINLLPDSDAKENLKKKFARYTFSIKGYNKVSKAPAGSLEGMYAELFSFLEDNGFNFQQADKLMINLASKTVGMDMDNPAEIIQGVSEVVTLLLQGKPEFNAMVEILETLPEYTEALNSATDAEAIRLNREVSKVEAGKLKAAVDREFVAEVLNGAYTNSMSDEMKANFNPTFLDSLKAFIQTVYDLFTSLTPDAKESLNKLAEDTINETLEDPKKLFSAKPHEGYTLVDFQKAFDEDPTAAWFEDKLSMIDGTILTGSIALAAQGTVYRPTEGQVHDLDYVNVAYDQEGIKKEVLNKFPGSIVANEFKASPNTATSIFIIPQNPNYTVTGLTFRFKGPKIMANGEPDLNSVNNDWVWYGYPGIRENAGTQDLVDKLKAAEVGIRPKIVGYDTVDTTTGHIVDEFKITQTGPWGSRHDIETHTDETQKSMMIDFFTGPLVKGRSSIEQDFTYNGVTKKVMVAKFDSVIEAKLESSRAKDILDYKLFQHFSGSAIQQKEGIEGLDVHVNAKGSVVVKLADGKSLIFGATGEIGVVTMKDGKAIYKKSEQEFINTVESAGIPQEVSTAIQQWVKANKNDFDNGYTIAEKLDEVIKLINPSKNTEESMGEGTGKDILTDIMKTPIERDMTAPGDMEKFPSALHAAYAQIILNRYMTPNVEDGTPEISEEGEAALKTLHTLRTDADFENFRKSYNAHHFVDGKFEGAFTEALNQYFEQNKDSKKWLINTLNRNLAGVDTMFANTLVKLRTRYQTEMKKEKFNTEFNLKAVLNETDRQALRAAFSDKNIGIINGILNSMDSAVSIRKALVSAIAGGINGNKINTPEGMAIFSALLPLYTQMEKKIGEGSGLELNRVLKSCKG